VDAHNLRAPAATTEGGREVFRHAERRVPPFLPEPGGPDAQNEVLPFVVVGAEAAAAGGAGPLMHAYADAFLDRAAVTHEVEAFAREAAGGKTGLEAARALHAAVMARFQGRDAGLSGSAGATVAQDRGSRLMTLKAALAAVGLRARVAMVRTFGADPASYRFPTEALFPYACLVLELPGSAPVWLDTSVRWAPFGQLPEQAAGGREAYLWPEPGLPLQAVRTPEGGAPPPKRVELTASVSEDGTLVGEGRDTYAGFEAAALSEGFSQLSGDKRRQALQGALGRYFSGAELGEVQVDEERGVGKPFSLRYTFRAPGFARPEGDKRVLGPLTFPQQLGRRYLQLSRRQTQLVIDASDATETVVRLKLPRGWTLARPEPKLEVASPFGRLERRERLEGDTLVIEESLRVNMARVSPTEYEAFGGFAGQVDLVQGRELDLQKP